MGPVWRLIKNQKDMCHRCGREIVDYPAVGTVVNFQFQPEEKYCWECYAYIAPFVDDVGPRERPGPVRHDDSLRTGDVARSEHAGVAPAVAQLSAALHDVSLPRDFV